MCNNFDATAVHNVNLAHYWVNNQSHFFATFNQNWLNFTDNSKFSWLASKEVIDKALVYLLITFECYVFIHIVFNCPLLVFKWLDWGTFYWCLFDWSSYNLWGWGSYNLCSGNSNRFWCFSSWYNTFLESLLKSSIFCPSPVMNCVISLVNKCKVCLANSHKCLNPLSISLFI